MTFASSSSIWLSDLSAWALVPAFPMSTLAVGALPLLAPWARDGPNMYVSVQNNHLTVPFFCSLGAAMRYQVLHKTDRGWPHILQTLAPAITVWWCWSQTMIQTNGSRLLAMWFTRGFQLSNKLHWEKVEQPWCRYICNVSYLGKP